MHLDGKVAIVTGGASLRGIGWVTARRFAEEGARVAVVLKIESARSAARAIGPQHSALACDVRDEAACREAVKRVLDAYGRVHILVGPHYSAAKGALQSLAKAMARELAPDGIRV
jgi:NAD(P)-dependent dehydrogenase (short-subunit alcohol dehydrogenase family)